MSKGYEDKLYVEVEADEAAAVKGLVQGHKLPDEVAKDALACKDLKALKEYLDADGQKRQESYTTAKAAADALTDPDAKKKAVHEADLLAESEAAKKLKGLLTVMLLSDLGSYIWTNHLKSHWPKFLYFDEYYQMEGHVNIEKLKERQNTQKLRESDRPMLGLFDLARLKLDELINPQRTEQLVANLEGASNHLSRQILKYWSQNQHVQVRFDVRPARPGDPDEMRNGTNLWGRVQDTVHQVSTQLGSRSKGFLWFFSFLAWFSQQIKPGSEELRAVIGSVTGDLRGMACQEPAARLNLGQRLDEVASAIEEAIHFNRYSGRENHNQYVGLVTRAVELATALKKEWTDNCVLNRDNLTAIHKHLYEMRRQLDNLVSRLPKQFQRPGGLEEAHETANSLGLDLCRKGQFDLGPVQPGLAVRLSEIGRNLHLVGVTIDYAGGMGRGRLKATETLERFAKEFGALIDGLPLPR